MRVVTLDKVFASAAPPNARVVIIDAEIQMLNFLNISSPLK
jgi:hypothetical protein